MSILKTNRPVVRSFYLLLFCFFLNATVSGQDSKQRTNDSVRTSQVSDAVKASFGEALEPVTGFMPFYLTGDFNSDSAEDVLVVVRIKRARSKFPNDVRMLTPFGYGGPVTFPTDLDAKPALAFAVIHGGKAGWNTIERLGKFLLYGDSPILILQYDRTTGPEQGKGLMSLMSKQDKRRRGERLPATAKGDAVLLGTEAADGILYWTGKTYRWKESEQD